MSAGPSRAKPAEAPAPAEPALTPYQKGQLASEWSEESAETQGDTVVGTEVDLIFNVNGQSVGIRADVLAQNADGEYIAIEAKYSPQASFTPNQSIVYPALARAQDEGGLVATVGARSGALRAGTQILVQGQVDTWTSSPELYSSTP